MKFRELEYLLSVIQFCPLVALLAQVFYLVTSVSSVFFLWPSLPLLFPFLARKKRAAVKTSVKKILRK